MMLHTVPLEPIYMYMYIHVQLCKIPSSDVYKMASELHELHQRR